MINGIYHTKNSMINVFAPLHQLSAHLRWTHGTILQSVHSSPIRLHILKIWTSLWKLLLVHSFSCVQLFVIPWTAAHQASLSIPNSQSLLKLMPIESVIPYSHLILCRPLLLPPSIFLRNRLLYFYKIEEWWASQKTWTRFLGIFYIPKFQCWVIP